MPLRCQLLYQFKSYTSAGTCDDDVLHCFKSCANIQLYFFSEVIDLVYIYSKVFLYKLYKGFFLFFRKPIQCRNNIAQCYCFPPIVIGKQLGIATYFPRIIALAEYLLESLYKVLFYFQLLRS